MLRLLRLSWALCIALLLGAALGPTPSRGQGAPFITVWDTENSEALNNETTISAEGTSTETKAADPLTVDLVFLSANLGVDATIVSWRTATESNNQGFRVQRRAGEGAWENLGFVAGAGTTAQPQSYQFTDANLPSDDDSLTYRLEQVELDETTHLTPQVLIGTSPDVPAGSGVAVVESGGQINFELARISHDKIGIGRVGLL